MFKTSNKQVTSSYQLKVNETDCVQLTQNSYWSKLDFFVNPRDESIETRLEICTSVKQNRDKSRFIQFRRFTYSQVRLYKFKESKEKILTVLPF